MLASTQFTSTELRRRALISLLTIRSSRRSGALQLRASANLYISGRGGRSALGMHTDTSHVLVVQVLGSKRWRVHAPPPVDFRRAHPLERGKHGDTLLPSEAGAPLVHTVLQSGGVLYIPAGHPHQADSAHEEAGETSLHLTIGLRSEEHTSELQSPI